MPMRRSRRLWLPSKLHWQRRSQKKNGLTIMGLRMLISMTQMKKYSEKRLKKRKPKKLKRFERRQLLNKPKLRHFYWKKNKLKKVTLSMRKKKSP